MKLRLRMNKLLKKNYMKIDIINSLIVVYAYKKDQEDSVIFCYKSPSPLFIKMFLFLCQSECICCVR